MNGFVDTRKLIEAEKQRTGTPDAGEKRVAELAKLTELAYQKIRAEAAAELNIGVGVLDKLVRQRRARSEDEQAELPHWKVEPWDAVVPGVELLDSIKAMFETYIVLPAGAGEAFALWVLHAWTFDAGDISPFLVLVSPTKRCGKTNTLIILFYLTPRSELASNISPSALFRYVEAVRPTLLMDEADTFVKDNEEMRGVLDSGHTKPSAYVIRNVEISGEHKPRRFSTWAPKAIATIRGLADTLEDRSIVVQLQRKPKAAKVARLRKRDSDKFAILRRKAARWAADNFSKLTDPDPTVPEILNDRAADNWRPLIAIADLAGGPWPRWARDAACVLSGEGHDSSSINVELLADIRQAFGSDAVAKPIEAIRSIDLVTQLAADPERPWVEWKNGKPLSQKQLGGLLSDFGITSETVSISGLADAKGYKRVSFEEAWERYLPGQNTLARSDPPSEASKRRNADGTNTSDDFQSVAEDTGDGSKNGNLSYSDAGSDASTLRRPPTGRQGGSATNLTTAKTPPADLPERAASSPTPSTKATEPAPPASRTEPAPTRAEVESPETGRPDEDDPASPFFIPPACRRRPPRERPNPPLCCAQCNAPGDAKGPLIEHRNGVWLHRECRRFFEAEVAAVGRSR
jgi:hypothetical protein